MVRRGLAFRQGEFPGRPSPTTAGRAGIFRTCMRPPLLQGSGASRLQTELYFIRLEYKSVSFGSAPGVEVGGQQGRMGAASLNGLNTEQVRKAAKALLTYSAKKSEESNNLLQDDELLYLVRWTRACSLHCRGGGATHFTRPGAGALAPGEDPFTYPMHPHSLCRTLRSRRFLRSRGMTSPSGCPSRTPCTAWRMRRPACL